MKMRIEQLNRHEELSYVKDSEANQEILKNTVCKDELCRFLTPLKFLEIDTWRNEVANGGKPDDSEKYRKWRTPIEILLCSNSLSTDEDERIPSGKRKFEKIRRQNEEILQKLPSKHRNSAQRRSHMIRPRIRQISSASNLDKQRKIRDTAERPQTEQKLSRYSADKFAEIPKDVHHSFGGLSPTNGHHIMSSKRLQNLNSHSNPLNRNVFMASYFVSKPQSRLLNRRRSDPSIKNTDHSSFDQSSKGNAYNNKEDNKHDKSKNDEHFDDVRVIPFQPDHDRSKHVSVSKRPATSNYLNNHNSNKSHIYQDKPAATRKISVDMNSTGRISLSSVNYGSTHTIDSGISMSILKPHHKSKSSPKMEIKNPKIEVIRQINSDNIENTKLPIPNKGAVVAKQRHVVGQTREKRGIVVTRNGNNLVNLYSNPYNTIDALDRVPLAHWSGKPAYFARKHNNQKTVTFRLSSTSTIAT